MGGEYPASFQGHPKSQIPNLKWINGGPRLRLPYEIKVALLAEEAVRVARKSSCTAQSC